MAVILTVRRKTRTGRRDSPGGWEHAHPTSRPSVNSAVAPEHGMYRGKAERLSNQEVCTLLLAALSINDKFRFDGDHVEFVGSMNDAEYFRDLVNRLWHKSEGWEP